MQLNVEIRGMDKLVKDLDKADAATEAAVKTAMYSVAHEMMEKSIKITPKDDNHLRDSWYITRPVRIVNFVELGYGMEYANYVHEMPDTTNWTEPGTGNKYLEKIVIQYRSKLVRVIRRKAKKYFDLKKTSPDASLGSAPSKPTITRRPSK
jgi:hypothetical protein